VSPACKFFIVLTLVLVGGCSSTTFIYNRLDFILPWYLDDYVELNRAQDAFLDEQLAPFLAWHRSEELPRYLDILDSIDAALDRKMSAEDIGAISLDFERAWFRLEERALEWLLALGEELSDDQVREFIDELWKKQEKYEKKYLERSDDEFREDSYESMVDNLQDYLGRLDAAQKQVLEEASGQLIRSDATWLRERADWLRRLEVFLQREPGWQDRIREAIANRSETLSEEYVQLYDHNLRIIYTALAEVLNSRTEKQDRRLRNRLSDLRKDLETLISQGRGRASASAA
jgi:hypothetical protein